MKPPLAIYKADGAWRWACRACSRSDWRGRHSDALTEARKHLNEHTSFGFRQGRSDHG